MAALFSTRLSVAAPPAPDQLVVLEVDDPQTKDTGIRASTQRFVELAEEGLRDCFYYASLDHPSASGRLILHVEVAPTGRVSAVKLVGGEALGKVLHACCVSALNVFGRSPTTRVIDIPLVYDLAAFRRLVERRLGKPPRDQCEPVDHLEQRLHSSRKWVRYSLLYELTGARELGHLEELVQDPDYSVSSQATIRYLYARLGSCWKAQNRSSSPTR